MAVDKKLEAYEHYTSSLESVANICMRELRWDNEIARCLTHQAIYYIEVN